jgi:hypothetical protein
MQQSEQPGSQPVRWWPVRKRQNFLVTTLAVAEILGAPSIIKMHADLGVLDLTAILFALGIPAIGGISASVFLWPLIRPADSES